MQGSLAEKRAAVTYCRITLPGEASAHIVTPNLNAPPSPGQELSYFGAGFENGQCGFKIDHAKDVHNGVFTCNFHMINLSIESSGNMTVVVASEYIYTFFF